MPKRTKTRHRRRVPLYKREEQETRRVTTFKPKTVTGQTENQIAYIKAIYANDIVLCSGVAGTGKTHIAVALAVEFLRKNKVGRIIICRPAVEAGEDLGYLPGDEDDKLGPYLRPIMDEMKEYASYSEMAQWKNDGKLEICPFAYMRGRNLKNAFVVADECQNAKFAQLKMLVTRLNEGSKLVIVGDPTQDDLGHRDSGGFDDMMDALENVEGVALVDLEPKDIVRSALVARCVEAIDKFEEEET